MHVEWRKKYEPRRVDPGFSIPRLRTSAISFCMFLATCLGIEAVLRLCWHVRQAGAFAQTGPGSLSSGKTLKPQTQSPSSKSSENFRPRHRKSLLQRHRNRLPQRNQLCRRPCKRRRGLVPGGQRVDHQPNLHKAGFCNILAPAC